jgi:hypothetical protein
MLVSAAFVTANASAVLAQPQVDEVRPKRASDRPVEVGHDGVDVDLVAKTSGEGGGGPLGVDARAIEPVVDAVLDPASERLEQGEGE